MIRKWESAIKMLTQAHCRGRLSLLWARSRGDTGHGRERLTDKKQRPNRRGGQSAWVCEAGMDYVTGLHCTFLPVLLASAAECLPHRVYSDRPCFLLLTAACARKWRRLLRANSCLLAERSGLRKNTEWIGVDVQKLSFISVVEFLGSFLGTPEFSFSPSHTSSSYFVLISL